MCRRAAAIEPAQWLAGFTARLLVDGTQLPD
jgi:hypothetical protein